MCGIAGMIDWRGQTSAQTLRSTGEAMNETLRHRGPDGSGVWVEAEAGSRSPTGGLRSSTLPGRPQPMLSADGRWVITFNGEIYNFGELRSELAARGRPLRGHSDTEVLLEACALWGVEARGRALRSACSPSRSGTAERTLSLVRDRLGIKPLY